MDPDDDLCLCFHVTKRKVQNFIKREQPRRASQLSECFGAGTGCGWCRPFLQRLWEQAQTQAKTSSADADNQPTGTIPHVEPTAMDYQQLRADYLQKKRSEANQPPCD